MVDQLKFYKGVGRLIRSARKRRVPALTQQALADRVSLSRTSITNIEQGRQKLLLHKLVDIAGALQVEIATLIPGHVGPETEKLNEVLRDRPSPERSWVESTVSAAKKRSSDGS